MGSTSGGTAWTCLEFSCPAATILVLQPWLETFQVNTLFSSVSKIASAYSFLNVCIWFWLIDNHDIISLKLYELTVIRSEKEEKEEEEEEITIPSVDNLELLRRKTNTQLHTLLSVKGYLLTSFVFFQWVPSKRGWAASPFSSPCYSPCWAASSSSSSV